MAGRSQASRDQQLKEVTRNLQITMCTVQDLAQVQRYDIVLLLDDSYSMNFEAEGTADHRSRWDELRSTVNTVVMLGTALDNDGISVQFLCRPGVENVSNPTQIKACFDVGPEGDTPLASRTAAIIQQHAAKGPGAKPMLLVICTDGTPDEGVASFQQVLRARDPNRVPVSILACTNDDEAVGYLNTIDREVQGVDVMDDFTSEGIEVKRTGRNPNYTRGDHAARLLLGPIIDKWDKMDEHGGAPRVVPAPAPAPFVPTPAPYYPPAPAPAPFNPPAPNYPPAPAPAPYYPPTPAPAPYNPPAPKPAPTPAPAPYNPPAPAPAPYNPPAPRPAPAPTPAPYNPPAPAPAPYNPPAPVPAPYNPPAPKPAPTPAPPPFAPTPTPAPAPAPYYPISPSPVAPTPAPAPYNPPAPAPAPTPVTPYQPQPPRPNPTPGPAPPPFAPTPTPGTVVPVQPVQPAGPQPTPRLLEITRSLQITMASAQELMLISQYDVVLLLDDSGSMNLDTDAPQEPGKPRPTRWDELRTTTNTLVMLATALDTDGINVQFLNRQGLEKVTGPSQVRALFEEYCNKGTPLATRTQMILSAHAALGPSAKPMLLVICTDGSPDEGEDAFYQVLRSRDPSRVKVSILACTDDDAAVGYLNTIDKQVPGVDCLDDFISEGKEVRKTGREYTRGDHAARLLLGPILNKWDIMDENGSGAGVGGPYAGVPVAGRPMGGAVDVTTKQAIIMTIHSAANLLAADRGGTSDPYVRGRLDTQRTRTDANKVDKAMERFNLNLPGMTQNSTHEVKTRAIDKTLNPTWEERLTLHGPFHPNEVLELDVFDKDMLRSELLGTVHIPLADIFHLESHMRFNLTGNGPKGKPATGYLIASIAWQ